MKRLVLFLTFIVTIVGYSQNIMINPYQTEPSVVMDKSTFQTEIGVFSQHFGREHLTYTAFPTIGLAYGLLSKLELQFNVQLDNYVSKAVESEQKYNYWSDIAIGGKYQLLNKESVNTQIAFWSQAILPTSNIDAKKVIGVSNKLSVSHSILSRVAIVYNIGYDYISDSNVFTYATALGYEFSDKLGVYIEPYGFYEDVQVFESNIDFGISYVVGNIGLDLTMGL